MRTIEIEPADAELSRLLDQMSGGEEIVLSRAGRPVAKLIPFTPAKLVGKRVLGGLQGKFVIPDDFDAPLPDDIQRALEGLD